MTVGLELSQMTGFPLFHNHVSIDAVLPVFEYGSPQFSRLVARFRDHVFEEAAKSELQGLIFTMVWAFDLASDRRFVERQKAVFESNGGRVVFVELQSDLATRVTRSASDLRLSSKPFQRDVEASRMRMAEMDENYQLDSKGAFPFPEYVRIDNTQVTARTVAEQIVERFDLVHVGEPYRSAL